MAKHWTDPIEKFVKSPKVQFSMGSLLLVVTVSEIFFFEPEHSIALIAVFHISQGLPSVLQALERIARWATKKRKDEI